MAVGASEDAKLTSKVAPVKSHLKRKEPCEERELRPLAQAKTAKLAEAVPKTLLGSARIRAARRFNAKSTGKAPEPDDILESIDVGSVHETDSEHRQRHSGQPGSAHCSRCNFILHKAELARKQPWCTPRPQFLGGLWRPRCDLYRWKSSVQGSENTPGAADAIHVSAYLLATRSSIMGRTSPWELIEQHATYTGHRASDIAARRVAQRPPARLSQEPKQCTETKKYSVICDSRKKPRSIHGL